MNTNYINKFQRDADPGFTDVKKELKDNYIPFGEEWESMMMKMPKKFIIDMHRKKCQENQQPKDNWISVNAALPEPGKLVWVKRQHGGSIYLAFRQDKPISTNKDASRECHWYGSSRIDGLYGNAFDGWQPQGNFSDVTVIGWKELF